MKSDVWCVPLGTDLALIYAPFHGISTLVNRSLAGIVSRCLRDADEPVPDVAPWIRDLRRPAVKPERHQGKPDPLFLYRLVTCEISTISSLFFSILPCQLESCAPRAPL